MMSQAGFLDCLCLFAMDLSLKALFIKHSQFSISLINIFTRAFKIFLHFFNLYRSIYNEA